MTKKIFRSIFLATVSILLASLLVIMGVLYEHFTASQEKQLKTMLSLTAAGVEEAGLRYLQGLNEDCRVTWVGADGTVLYDSERNVKELENHSQREEIQQAMSSGEGSSIRYSHTLTQKTMYRTRKLSDGSILRVSYSTLAVWLLVLGMLQPISIVFFFALVLSLVLAHKLSEKIVRPLANLDLDHPLAQVTYPELTPLLQRMEHQHKKIEHQKQELADRRLSLKFAEENRREFTANVSHELKTPLQSILGSAELIETNLVKPQDLPHFAGKIRKEANRLLALIEDIIHLSRLDENTPMTFSPVSLSEVCEEEIVSLLPVAEAYEVEVSLQGDTLTVHAVPQLVKEIVHNLLDNAIKYNHPGGWVTVTLLSTEKGASLSVSDNGIGIPFGEQERIFERFYRVDKSHSRETGGTGLGLSIVKHAAAYLGAEITLKSAVEKGTTITVNFPPETVA